MLKFLDELQLVFCHIIYCICNLTNQQCAELLCKSTDLIPAINDINNFTANTKAAKKGRIKLQSSSQ